MAALNEEADGRSWDNALKGFVVGALVGGLVGLSAALSLVLTSGGSISLALATLALFTVLIAGVAGFIGALVDLDRREQTWQG